MSAESVKIVGRASVTQRLKAEFLNVLPAVVFFFLALNFINFTHALLFHKQQITLYSELDLIIGSAIAGKVLPLVDLLPFLNVLHGKPLIYVTLWKTSIYSLGALLFRYCDFFLPFISKYKDLGVAIRQWILEEDWYRFYGVQLWVFALLFVYIAAKETTKKVGGERMRRLFFGF
jgi:hypothetical protein